jgi:selenide,water dikinase
VDEGGFITVDRMLRSVSHPEVFAAGDVAAMPDPRPKSGVFAVRQGPVLTENLRRAASGRSLKPYRPQKSFLGLISTGDTYAVASRGDWSWEGKALWTWKDWIDRRFMRRFNELPEMAQEAGPKLGGVADAEAIRELSTLAMRCGGCGAKVGSTVLSRVINRLPAQRRDDVLIGLDSPDDAAAFEVPPGKLMVQSVDYFRAFIDDPYTFGRIAANHALGDIFAMGAEAQSALAIATVPYGRERIVEQTLSEVMTGALDTLGPTGAVLAGGHSSEGAELAFGLTVNGLIEKDALLRKGGMRPGDALILTKPIGTGTLFAADMRGKAQGRWVDGAIRSMLVSNQDAAACLHRLGATACTDVTGFGLLGHLVEMARASDVDVQLDLKAVPVLDGAEQTVAAGILSSLQPQNLRLRRAVRDPEALSAHPRYPLLFDPQTAGGLLASLPADAVAQCLDELHHLGYEHSVIIGRVETRSDEAAPVQVSA